MRARRLYIRAKGIPGAGAVMVKPADHPTIGDECPACDQEFKAGDRTVLVMIGPGTSSLERRSARAGRHYVSTAVELHALCAGAEGE